MIDLKSLPRSPEDAFSALLTSIRETTSTHPAGKAIPTQVKIDLINRVRALKNIAPRFSCGELADDVLDLMLKPLRASRTDGMEQNLDNLDDMLLAETMDSHFISEADEEEFERIYWQKKDRAAVQELLSEARRFIQSSDSFDDRQTREILHYLAKVENEVLRPVGNFDAFLAMSCKVSGIVKKIGEDAQPLADAVEKMRTTTQRNITGHEQLEAPEEQKQIAPPTDN